MGEPPTSRSAGVTLRARTSMVAGIALLALTGVLLADALLRGRWDVFVLSLPALGLVTCVAVEVFLRPGIRLRPGGITVVNPLWTTEVPWDAVANVTTRFVVTVETTAGRRIRCWGAPTAARTRPGTADRAGVSPPAESSGWLRASSPHRVIESYVAQYGDQAVPRGAGEPPRRGFHLRTAAVTAALLLIVAGQVLAGR